MYNGDVIKSDFAASDEVKEALQKAIKPLEDVPDRLKDWHPGSDGKVLDLVYPILFPLVYGRSKILPTGSSVGRLRDDAGILRKAVWRRRSHPRERYTSELGNFDPWSNKFQWLPCEVDISGKGGKILTYMILHPWKHVDLYHVIEEVITSAIHLWDVTLITYCECAYDNDPQNSPETRTDSPQREEWYDETRALLLPEPGTYRPPSEPEAFSLKETGKLGRPLQIIVKLANIELTPEKLEYEGGTWHVEDELNEHICATALYYYASESITASLAFRQQSTTDVSDISYRQGERDWLPSPAVFDCEPDGPAVQVVGSVDTREGRFLTFPNVLQHQVQPFELVDPTKPGHRKILAL